MSLARVSSIRGALLVCLVLFVVGCEAAPDLKNPKIYQGAHVTFSYPGNWTVSEGETEQIGEISLQMVTIETPGDGILTLNTFSPPSGADVAEFAATLEENRSLEIKEMFKGLGSAVEVSKSKISKLPPQGTSDGGVRHDFAIKLLGETVPHWGDTLRFDGKEADVLTYAQGAHEDWALMEPGFDLVYATIQTK